MTKSQNCFSDYRELPLHSRHKRFGRQRRGSARYFLYRNGGIQAGSSSSCKAAAEMVALRVKFLHVVWIPLFSSVPVHALLPVCAMGPPQDGPNVSHQTTRSNIHKDQEPRTHFEDVFQMWHIAKRRQTQLLLLRICVTGNKVGRVHQRRIQLRSGRPVTQWSNIFQVQETTFGCLF